MDERGSLSNINEALVFLHLVDLVLGDHRETTLSSAATDTIYKESISELSWSVSIECVCIISVACPVNVYNT